jgi:uncharacterized protein YoxC
MKYTYSESAQLRVARQGAAAITAFIEELSPASQEKILTTRPPIPGFRKNGPALVKKQRELLAGALGHVPDDNRRPKKADWMAFGAIWSLWGHQKFATAFPSGPLNFDETSSDEALDFVRNLVEKCNSGCAREDIDRLVLFSGLPTTDAVEAFIARLPLRANLERDKALAKLPEELGSLRHQTKEIERNVGKLADELKTNVEDVENAARSAQQSVVATAALQGSFAEFEKRLSASSSKQLQNVADRVAFYSKQMDVLRKDYEDTRRALGVELSKKHQSLQKHVNTLTEEVADVRASIDALVKSQQGLAESLKSSHLTEFAIVADGRSSASYNKESHLHYETVWMDLGSGKEAKDQVEIENLFQLTQGNVIASGVRQSDADRVTRTLVAAMIAGQLLQCSGSLADVLGTAAAASCGGKKVLSWQVPLGLRSTVEANSVQRIAESGAAGAVMLRGINRSAFEIYGTGVRDAVVRRHLQRQEGGERLALIATYAEGPATLPMSTSLVELGPLVDTDTLAWGESAEWRSLELGKLVLERQHFRSPLSFRDEIDEIHRLVDALGTPPTKLWRIIFLRFVNVLFLLPGAKFENSVSVALRAWVLPWAKVKGLGRERVEDAIRACAIEQLDVPDVRSALDDLVPETVA